MFILGKTRILCNVLLNFQYFDFLPPRPKTKKFPRKADSLNYRYLYDRTASFKKQGKY